MPFALVTNSVEPYLRDVTGVMAQFKGSRFRFRYRSNPEHDFVGSLEPAKMVGASGIVFLRDADTGELHPIRHINIGTVFSSGRLLVIRFFVGEFPDLSQTTAINTLREHIHKNAKHNSTAKGLEPLVYEVPNEIVDKLRGKVPVSHDDDVKRWLRIVESIGKSKSLNKHGFLYLHSIVNEDSRFSVLPAIGGQILLEPDSSHTCDVLSYSILPDDSDAMDEATLSMVVDEKAIAPVINEASLVSRYDDHLLSFRTQNTTVRTASHVRFKAETADENVVGIAFPTINLGVSVKASVWQWISAVAGLIAIVGATIVPASRDVIAKVLQAIGVLLIAAPGKDFYGSWIKRFFSLPEWKQLAQTSERQETSELE